MIPGSFRWGSNPDPDLLGAKKTPKEKYKNKHFTGLSGILLRNARGGCISPCPPGRVQNIILGDPLGLLFLQDWVS